MLRFMVRSLALALLAGTLGTGCTDKPSAISTTADSSTTRKQFSADQPAKTQPITSRKLPEYLGVFYIDTDSLVDMFDRSDFAVNVYQLRPLFYVFGQIAGGLTIGETVPGGKSNTWRTRVYPLQHPSGIPLFRVELWPGIELAQNSKCSLRIAGLIVDKYMFSVKTRLTGTSKPN